MRISDWSSDVCSSDLDTPAGLTAWPPLTTVSQPLEAMGSAVIDALAGGAADTPHFSFRLGQRDRDRKSVGEGKSVSVRVDLGGRRIIKKKKKKDSCTDIGRGSSSHLLSRTQKR